MKFDFKVKMHKPLSKKNQWLTNFCDSMRIFVSIIMVQILVFIYSLSFLSFDFEYLRKLSILTLLAQLIAFTLLILLCKMRPVFNRFRVIEGVALLVFLVVIVTTLLSQLIGILDMQLTFYLFKTQQAVNHLNIKLSVSSLVICLALLRYFYIQDQWNIHIQQLADARLLALQARIKPHFLFNSLNSITSLIGIDVERAETAIVDFSELMRKTFTQKDSLISLKEELYWIRKYLAIEKLRLDKRLSFQIECCETLLPHKIPILCLQPLVENAIIHGIQPLEKGGKIDVCITADDKHLMIQVNNPYKESTKAHSNGMALKNIQERLLLLYGSKAIFQIVQDNSQYSVKMGIPL